MKAFLPNVNPLTEGFGQENDEMGIIILCPN